jgi:hypothetical protein
MIENWKTREEAKTNILYMLANKGKIMGPCNLLGKRSKKCCDKRIF